MTHAEIKTRPLIFGEDYPELCEWWRQRKWHAPAKSKLSQYGLIAEDSRGKLAAAWFYFTGSSWGFLEYIVTNPTAPIAPRGRAVRLLIEKFADFAAKNGVEDVLTFTESPGLKRMLQKSGFHVGDKNLTSFIRRVSV
jgi:hypothetical protein